MRELTHEDAEHLDNLFAARGVIDLGNRYKHERVRLHAQLNEEHARLLVWTSCAGEPRGSEWLPGEIHCHVSFRGSSDELRYDAVRMKRAQQEREEFFDPGRFKPRPWLLPVKTWGENEQTAAQLLRVCPEMFAESGWELRVNYGTVAFWIVLPILALHEG